MSQHNDTAVYATKWKRDHNSYANARYYSTNFLIGKWTYRVAVLFPIQATSMNGSTERQSFLSCKNNWLQKYSKGTASVLFLRIVPHTPFSRDLFHLWVHFEMWWSCIYALFHVSCLRECLRPTAIGVKGQAHYSSFWAAPFFLSFFQWSESSSPIWMMSYTLYTHNLCSFITKSLSFRLHYAVFFDS